MKKVRRMDKEKDVRKRNVTRGRKPYEYRIRSVSELEKELHSRTMKTVGLLLKQSKGGKALTKKQVKEMIETSIVGLLVYFPPEKRYAKKSKRKWKFALSMT